MEVEVQPALYSLMTYFMRHRDSMHDRAPRHWTAPQPLACRLCGLAEHARPVVAPKKRHINWLFLLLTETLGTCTLEQPRNILRSNPFVSYLSCTCTHPTNKDSKRSRSCGSVVVVVLRRSSISSSAGFDLCWIFFGCAPGFRFVMDGYGCMDGWVNRSQSILSICTQ